MAGFEKAIKDKGMNVFLYIIGIVFMALAKIKNMLRGYSTPRPFPVGHLQHSIDYDISVASKWISFLEQYTGEKAVLTGKTALELGPGADLGAAFYLIFQGLDHYCAIDPNDLALSAPDALYDLLLKRLSSFDSKFGSERAATELAAFRRGMNGNVKYIVRPDFNIEAAIASASVDLVFSQAAFEHFDDVEETIRQLSIVARPGAFVVSEIDLATHSRWIRDVDPLNIYRYSDRVYSMFTFRGSPNRVLPQIYRDAFERAGWKNIWISPLKTVGNAALNRIKPGLDRRYAAEIISMPATSIMLCATKG
jgi:SAM-dependent methyltransferase